mmetsp:Transcript_26303/g.62418  ORF Transcript_26303/g.62418 Transcript_26303/m.62418 type:complete len:241 (+) Transcript_26303:1497-2219(+)
MLGAAQRADGAGNGRVHVAARAGDDARGEGASVELMLGIEVERRVHGAHPALRRRRAVQQTQEVAADGVVVRLHLDAAALRAPVIPVQQHGAQAGHEPVGDVAGAGQAVVVLLGQDAAQRRHAGAHHVHRVGASGQAFQRLFHTGRQAAHGPELGLVGAQLGARGQLAVHQQVGDLLELADLGDVQDVVAAVMQVVAAAADGAQRGIAGRHAGQRHRFLRLEAGGRGFAHGHVLQEIQWA